MASDFCKSAKSIFPIQLEVRSSRKVLRQVRGRRLLAECVLGCQFRRDTNFTMTYGGNHESQQHLQWCTVGTDCRLLPCCQSWFTGLCGWDHSHGSRWQGGG